MSSWKSYKLGDIAEITSSKRIFYSEYVPSGIPFWRSKEVIEKFNRKNISTDLFISNEKYQEIKSKFGVPQQNDILLTSVGTLGIPYLVQSDEQFYFKDGNLTWIKNINNELLNPLFLFKWLASSIGRESLSEITIGSTQEALTISGLKTLELLLPPLEEQKAIAEVLSSLDDKIDLLHRQNQTLESLAQTLFRQWFEDKEFDGIIGDIIKLQSGYAFKSKDFQDFGIHGVLKIKNISNSIIDIFNTDFIDLTVANKTDEKFKILSGDILFGMTGAEIGKMGIVPKTDKNLWLNQRVGVLREKYLGAKYLAYLQLTSEFGFDYITNTATGSAQPNISASEIEQCPFVKLEVDEIENYSNEISSLFEKIIFNLGQIQTLENLRDTLLPKLLSGEIKVEI